MSGAFNIDIECGKGSAPKTIKIHCASLTDTWSVERSQNNIQKFLNDLSSDEAIKKNKVQLERINADNIDGCEQFLSRLGCTAAVLRIGVFHNFLNVPQSVRDGLTYASHKPFGKGIREGYLQRHPRFVSRGGGKRYIRLTKDDRGGSLICYKDENNKNLILSSLKIGASTELQNLKDKGIPNAFVLKSGKRQWVLQAISPRDYQTWQSSLVSILKQFGPVNVDTSNALDTSTANNQATQPRTKSPRGGDNNNNNYNNNMGGNVGKILKENQEITEKIKKMKQRMVNLASEIDRYKDLEIEIKTNEAELKRKGQKQFTKEKEELIAEYEVKQDNLRAEIEELHRKLEQKTADEGGRSGLKSLFGDDFEVANLNEIKDNAGGISLAPGPDGDGYDDEEEPAGGVGGGGTGGQSTNYLDEDGDANNGLLSADASHKWLHKHLHRHDHKHIHFHRHTHIHDHTGDEPVTYTHTHTIAHTITHTMTQFKVKKNVFGV